MLQFLSLQPFGRIPDGSHLSETFRREPTCTADSQYPAIEPQEGFQDSFFIQEDRLNE